ncbi:MAG: type II secretion system protein GspL [Pseudomonadota bacterium]
MARQAYLRFRGDADGPIDAAVSGPRGIDVLPGGIADLKQREDVIVFVPGTDVGWHSVTLPARNEREARRAAPFAIEDELAAPAEEMHVAVSVKAPDGSRTLLTCTEKLLRAWTERLGTEGISPQCIVPEHAVLPQGDCAVDLQDRILMRINGRPLALDADGPDDLFRAVAATATQPLEVYGEAVARQLGVPAVQSVDGDALATLIGLDENRPSGLDLRQGVFAARQSISLTKLQSWRRPLAIAAGAGLVWLGATAWETARLNAASAELASQARGAYSVAFSDEAGVTNPASRIQDKLGAGLGIALELDRAAAGLMTALEDVEGARLRSIRYDRDSGEVRASVDYARYGDDQRLATSLESLGLIATLGDSRANGSLVTGEMMLRAGS